MRPCFWSQRVQRPSPRGKRENSESARCNKPLVRITDSRAQPFTRRSLSAQANATQYEVKTSIATIKYNKTTIKSISRIVISVVVVLKCVLKCVRTCFIQFVSCSDYCWQWFGCLALNLDLKCLPRGWDALLSLLKNREEGLPAMIFWKTWMIRCLTIRMSR